MAEGSTKDLPIVIDEVTDESDSEQAPVVIDLSSVIEPVQVDGSPLKVLSSHNYRKVIVDVSDDPGSDSDSDNENLKVHKRIKFEELDEDPEDQPVYETPPMKYSAERIIRILLDPIEDRICHTKPVAIKKSATYVVDVRALKNAEDLKKDEFGIWKYSGSHPQGFKVYTDDDGCKIIEKCSVNSRGKDAVFLRRLHCTHPSNSDFKRLICFLSDASHNPHHLCLLVYRIPPSFIPTVISHGNSKERKPFFPTWPSTRDILKKECQKQGPKETIAKVSSTFGGVIEAAGPGQLPRSENQISKLRRKEKQQDSSVHGDVAADNLFVVMQKAHTEDPASQFIQGIRTTPDPAIILAFDFQLDDLVRFCTSQSRGEFCVLTVDPTFSLGDFDVTPITYRHMLLETKRGKSHPIFLGPMLIHYRKTFGTYLFFASTLVGLSQHLQGIRAFGTDGEKALADAFMHEFTYSQRLTCFIHVKRNVKEKCSDLSIPSDVTQKIIDDIFGHRLGDVFVEGLVDSENDSDFQEKVDNVVTSWRELPSPSSADMEGFISWFLSYKVHTIRDSMLKSVREECGLGFPPAAFTTNASESLNAMLKHKVDYKKNELPLFIEKVKELVNEQRREVERAVIGRGKYRISEQYQFLAVPESQWFLMTPTQRKKHLSKFHTAAVKDPKDRLHHTDSLDSIDISPILPCTLSYDVTSASEKLDIPFTCLQGIWSKAEKLLTTKEAIVQAPGQASEARMVLSYSGKVPHMVTPNKSRSFCCDSNCVNWKSLGICAHSVAVAEINGKLLQFISLCKKKKKPNLTSLLTTDLPKGSGRKGAAPPRKRKSKEPVVTRIGMSLSSDSVPTCGPNSLAHSHPSTIQSPNSSNISVQFSPCTVSPQCNVVQSPYNYGSAFSYNYSGTNPNWYTGLYPPPFTCNPHYKPTVPFVVAFITGNISCCFGCRGKYSKSLPPPADLCIKHQDWREFTSTSTGTPQSRYGNVYYHCKPACVWLRNPSFVPTELEVPEEILEKLTLVHKEYLASIFDIAF